MSASSSPSASDPSLPGWMIAVWLTALALLPLTTPAFLPLGQTLVRPPSAILFGVLACGILLNAPLRRRALQDTGVRLLAVFVVWAVAAGAWLAWIAPDPPAKCGSSVGLYVRAMLTLGAGVATYVAARTMLRSNHDILRAWPFILGGLTASVLWAAVQRLSYTETGWPILGGAVSAVSALLSGTAEPPTAISLANARPHGLAYEPSWLASHVTVLLAPLGLFLACSSIGHRRIIAAGSIGVALIGAALGSSRIGLACIGATLVAGVAGLCRHDRRTALIAAAISIPALALSAVIAWRSPYIRAVIQHKDPPSESVAPADWPGSVESYGWTVRTNFMPRIAAGHAAMRIAAENPAAGVGIGQYATHFHKHVPAYAMQHGEVRSWAAPDHGRMANAKNMPLRIAAETGILGLAAWLLFISWHWRSGWSDPHWRILGATAAVAVLMDWISLDSFAFPQVWLLLALIVAARPDPASAHARA